MTPGNEAKTIETAAESFVSEHADAHAEPAKLMRAAFFAGAALGFQIAGDMLKESQL